MHYNKRVAAVKTYLDSKSRLKAEGDIKGLGKSEPDANCTSVKKRAEKIACMAKERRRDRVQRTEITPVISTTKRAPHGALF